MPGWLMEAAENVAGELATGTRCEQKTPCRYGAQGQVQNGGRKEDREGSAGLILAVKIS